MVMKSPLQVSPSPAQPSPSLELAEPDASPEAAADQLRQQAWHTAETHHWGSIILNPWSRQRESLFVRLIEHDETTTGLDSLPLLTARLAEKESQVTIETLLSPMLFIEQAALALYLAAHQPNQWDHLRGRPAAFLRAANDWAEQHIPAADEWSAIHLAVTLRTQHHAVIPMRPASRAGGPSGN
jgi:hypothetical protein